MKKLLLIAALFCVTMNIHAQDVFNELLSSSLKVAEDTKKDIVYSIVSGEAVKEIKRELDAYFIASKRNKLINKLY